MLHKYGCVFDCHIYMILSFGKYLSKQKLHRHLQLVNFMEDIFNFTRHYCFQIGRIKFFLLSELLFFFFFDHLFRTVPSIQCPKSSVSVIETINQSGSNSPLLISLQSKLWFSAVLFDFSLNRSQFYSFRFSLLLSRLRMKRTKWCQQFRFNFSLLSIKLSSFRMWCFRTKCQVCIYVG
jgi:hypothetical protein